ncbi:hypothetical protein MUS1_03085 [Marinomonas ushuaiensis DSM 15871]|uniref:Uncharacterized protein n=1 Tax=Marinomonas ushuaiensis DSM 15871 TaxID=1122207 RepID=X7E922_9GAMM|nr:hypothetical protein MUS1_03085 [Marinomonas ushuaiensis DSM 15871]
MVEKISAFLSEYLDSSSTIAIIDNPTKTHVDFMVNNEIHFRFDLYKQLPIYRNISLKPAFFSSVIESASVISVTEDNRVASIKVPSKTDDLILRYVEYHEYYAARPDKIKHVEYIQQKIVGNEIEQVKMLDKLHYYTAFPKVAYRKKTLKDRLVEKRDYYQSNLGKMKHLYATVGLRALICKITEKIRK